jgi:hypothetical protein
MDNMNLFSICRNPGCEAGIIDDTIEAVQIGAGLRLHAECRMGHKTSVSTCEFINNNRTAVIDIKISALQLLIGMNMSQECHTNIFVLILNSLQYTSSYVVN